MLGFVIQILASAAALFLVGRMVDGIRVRDARAAFGAAPAASGNASPPALIWSLEAMTIFWFGQIISQTLRNIRMAMTEPTKISIVSPAPRMASMIKPVIRVNIAPQRNHHKALGASLVKASTRASGSASLKYSVCTKLK